MYEALFALDAKTEKKNVTEILIGSKKMKFSSYSDDEFASIDAIVGKHMAAGSPIPMVAMYGAAKGYAMNDQARTVDGFDVLAIRRMSEVDARVRQVYSPGLRFTMVQEDVTEMLMTTNPHGLAKHMEDYRGGLGQLIVGMQAPVILKSERDILPSITDFIRRGVENKAKMLHYWGTGEKPEGWRGDLDRDYFLRKAGHEPGNAKERACQYLGLVMARQKAIPEGVRVGFYQYPKGVPKMGRVEWKLMDHQEKTIMPWVDHCVRVENKLVPWRENFIVDPVMFRGVHFNMGRLS